MILEIHLIMNFFYRKTNYNYLQFSIKYKIYNKSGIEGTKANSIIYCPNKNIYLICTLKGLPTKIKH